MKIYTEGKKKLFWFNAKQLSHLDEIQTLTKEGLSQIVRTALVVYLRQLKSK